MLSLFQNRWWIVVASILGLTVGAATINVFVFGVFLKPMAEDFGFSRADVASGLLATNLMAGMAAPIVGVLVDWFSIRQVMLPGLILFALTVASFSLLKPSLVLIWTSFGLAGLFGAVQSTVPYSVLISRWFDRDRGLALGIALAGVGLGVAVIPELAEHLVASYGWRTAYQGVGLTIVLLGFCPIALFFRNPPSDHRFERRHQNADRDSEPEAAAVMRSWRFWAMTFAFFIGVVSVNGTLVSVVPMLTDRGYSAATAAECLSGAGIAMVAGRILSGWCLDAFYGPYVAAGFFLLPIGGIGFLSVAMPQSLVVIGVLLCGANFGAQTGIQAYFIGRYFGLRAYGTVYGLTRSFFLAGSGLGPFLAALSYDYWHSYTLSLVAFEFSVAAAIFIFLSLGPYRFSSQEASPKAQPDTVPLPTTSAQVAFTSRPATIPNRIGE